MRRSKETIIPGNSLWVVDKVLKKNYSSSSIYLFILHQTNHSFYLLSPEPLTRCSFFFFINYILFYFTSNVTAYFLTFIAFLLFFLFVFYVRNCPLTPHVLALMPRHLYECRWDTINAGEQKSCLTQFLQMAISEFCHLSAKAEGASKRNG